MRVVAAHQLQQQLRDARGDGGHVGDAFRCRHIAHQHGGRNRLEPRQVGLGDHAQQLAIPHHRQVADAPFQHQVQHVRPQRIRRQRNRIGRHHGMDRGCRIAACGQHLVGQVAVGQDTQKQALIHHAQGRYVLVAHDLRRLEHGCIRRADDRLARHQVGDLAGGQVRPPPFDAAAAVEEPLERRRGRDQAAELGHRQQDQDGILGRARGGQRQPLAHQPAFAKAVARPQQRHQRPGTIHHLDRAGFHQIEAQQRFAFVIDLGACGIVPADEGTGDTRQLVLRQGIIGMHRFQKGQDTGVGGVVGHAVLPDLRRVGPGLSVGCGGGKRRPRGSCQWAWALPAPLGTRIDSTRSITWAGGALVTIDTM